jgi:hypothetical protein
VNALWKNKLRGPALAIMLVVSSGCASASGGSATTEAARLLSHLTPLERQILVNRTVNPQQYRHAAQATISCLRSAGFSVSNPTPGPDGILEYISSYSFGDKSSKTGPDKARQDRISAVQNTCDQESAAVQAVYILDHADNPHEIPVAFARMVSCLQAAGASLPGNEKLSRFSSFMRSVRTSIQNGDLTAASFNSCQTPFAAAELQPLPGLAEALANLKNP